MQKKRGEIGASNLLLGRGEHVRLPDVSLSRNDSGQFHHKCLLLSPNSIIWFWPNSGNALQLGW